MKKFFCLLPRIFKKVELKIINFFLNCRYKFDDLLLQYFQRNSISRINFYIENEKEILNSEKLRKIILEVSCLNYFSKNLKRNMREIDFLNKYHQNLQPLFQLINSKSILYSGQQYYHHWNLSENLKKKGWDSLLYDFDLNQQARKHYHGSDIALNINLRNEFHEILEFYLMCIYRFKIFHFSNVNSICFGFEFSERFNTEFGENFDIFLLKKLGKKIIYTQSGCNDGVSKSVYNKETNFRACKDCNWFNNEKVCSDKKNLAWGELRNRLSDFQITFGTSFGDFNAINSIIECPYLYNINHQLWSPSNSAHYIHQKEENSIYLYHTIANPKLRMNKNGGNIKSSHIYLPLIKKLNNEMEYKLELINPVNVNNIEIRKYIMKSDIVLDMLSFGWYGSTTREAMMLGKPVICYLNPIWIERISKSLPDFVNELPIVSANIDNVEDKLTRLIKDRQYREDVGKKSRAFAIKWHSTNVAGEFFDFFYKSILKN